MKLGKWDCKNSIKNTKKMVKYLNKNKLIPIKW